MRDGCGLDKDRNKNIDPITRKPLPSAPIGRVSFHPPPIRCGVVNCRLPLESSVCPHGHSQNFCPDCGYPMLQVGKGICENCPEAHDRE